MGSAKHGAGGPSPLACRSYPGPCPEQVSDSARDRGIAYCATHLAAHDANERALMGTAPRPVDRRHALDEATATDEEERNDRAEVLEVSRELFAKATGRHCYCGAGVGEACAGLAGDPLRVHEVRATRLRGPL